MRRWLRDWWRGWSDADLESVLQKLSKEQHEPGSMTFVSNRELMAHLAYIHHERDKRG